MDYPRQTPKHLGGHKYKTNIDNNSLRYLIDTLKIQSVLDLGCGMGGMIPLYQNYKLRYVAVDGDYYALNENNSIIIHDYTLGPFNINVTFDLCWCIETLGYIEEKFSDNYLHSIKKCKYLIMSDYFTESDYHHVNFQQKEYWINLFNKNGFALLEKETSYIRQHSASLKIRETGLIFVNNNDIITTK